MTRGIERIEFPSFRVILLNYSTEKKTRGSSLAVICSCSAQRRITVPLKRPLDV